MDYYCTECIQPCDIYEDTDYQGNITVIMSYCCHADVVDKRCDICDQHLGSNDPDCAGCPHCNIRDI